MPRTKPAPPHLLAGIFFRKKLAIAPANPIWIYDRPSEDNPASGPDLYCGSELRALLRKAGFSGVKIYGDLSGGAYDQSAKRLVVVAEKN